MKNYGFTAFLLLTAWAGSSSVWAESAPTTSHPSTQVALMASSCANCHGTDGKLAGAIPAIANRPAGVLEAQLLAFKQDQQPNTTVMNRIAKGFSDEELKALAEYFAHIGQD